MLLVGRHIDSSGMTVTNVQDFDLPADFEADIAVCRDMMTDGRYAEALDFLMARLLVECANRLHAFILGNLQDVSFAKSPSAEDVRRRLERHAAHDDAEIAKRERETFRG